MLILQTLNALHCIYLFIVMACSRKGKAKLFLLFVAFVCGCTIAKKSFVCRIKVRFLLT